MADYDIGAAFKAIEDELIASMIRNMDRHRAEETKEGYNWSMWQAEQLKALEKYKRENRRRFGKQFKDINGQIAALLQQARAEGNMQQEIQILRAIQRGYRFPNMPKKMFDLLEELDGKSFRHKASFLLKRFKSKEASKGTAEFFRLNDRKMEALIKATTDDMKRAETAVLRMADDQYRKIIFNAQVYANSGAGTYEKAVDMATKDMLAAGVNCMVYKNGARHTISDWADMAIRTANKRAYLQGEGEKRKEWGIATVIVNKRGNPCPKCLPFCGKVLIDDVWSGGSRKDGNYPLMSTAIAAGLYHPRCKDSHTTYFPGISTADDTWTEEELEAIGQSNAAEAKQQYAKRQAEMFGRLANYSLDEENQKQYAARNEKWNKVADTEKIGIIKESKAKEEPQVHSVGKIDKDIYKCVTDDLITDEVVITDRQIDHIKERHPNDFERYKQYFSTIVSEPDYIIEASKPKTALVLKEIRTQDNEVFKTVVRLATSEDNPEYKNSIITFMKIDEKEWNRLLRNKNILYKRE